MSEVLLSLKSGQWLRSVVSLSLLLIKAVKEGEYALSVSVQSSLNDSCQSLERQSCER